MSDPKVKSCERTGWEAFGIPAESGDGFAYNREGFLWANDVYSPTPECALRLSAVWACVQLISQTIATLPVGFYQRKRDGSREVATNHPLYGVLHSQPNAYMTAVQFWEAFVASMLLQGDAYAEKKYIGDRIVALDFLNSRHIGCKRLSNGKIEWTYTEYGKLRTIPENRMWHVPAFSTDGICGLSPIRYGAQVFGAATAADVAAQATFENGLHPTTYFKVDRILKQDQRDEFRANVKAKLAGALNAGQMPLLEGGMDVGTIGINPVDAQVLESRAWSLEEICRWFRVDPSMVGHGGKDSNFGTGIEQKMLGFLQFTLRPWLSRIEQSIRLNLLSDVEKDKYFAEFAVEGLLRADSKGRAELYASALNNGWMDSDEVRSLENLGTRGGNAAILRVQSAMIPLDKIGENAPAPIVPVAPSKQMQLTVGNTASKGYKIKRETDGTATAVPIQDNGFKIVRKPDGTPVAVPIED